MIIVAGIGFRREASCADIVTAVQTACDAYAIQLPELRLLAILPRHADAAIAHEAAAQLQIPCTVADMQALVSVRDQLQTHSPVSLRVTGFGSAAEAAALAALGALPCANSRLLGPRIKTRNATCALAQGKKDLDGFFSGEKLRGKEL
ncbi:Cobalamin biosynthesis protein G [gamma proteobacterium HdN1]|nr:Cobalamin biosynthesis protein G [gamma proteobacterium HdN1]